MADQEKEDDERCPLCPASGPPTRSTVDPNKSGDPTLNGDSQAGIEDSSLFWIACSKCSTWYHSCCLLLADEGVRQSVPQAVREEVEKNAKGDGPFQDWTVWINRWYCKTCLDLSNDPANPNRPHHPLLTTTKVNFPPRQPKRKSVGLARASSTSSHDTSVAPPKRAKLESAEGTPKADPADDSSAPARPKRQAALNRPDYHALHHHIATPTGKWLRLIADPEKYNTTILDSDFPRIRGDMVTRAWIEGRMDQAGSSSSGSLFYGTTREPLIVRPEDGGFEAMGGKLPDKSFTVQDVARLVGPDRQVDVIDVATQSSSQWSLKQWADYVRTGVDPTGNSSKVYNIISLEVTGTELAKRVRAPRLVREIDWVDNFWNFPGGKGVVVDEKNHLTNGINETEGKIDANGLTGETVANGASQVNGVKGNEHLPTTNGTTETTKPKGKAPSSWPKVQLYCLMGMKGSWTDWHVDFAASSVYYTIHTGSKVFYFIRPSERNLKAYNEWSGSYEMQQNTWLGDMCDEVRRVVLIEGDTMIIPAGYIHAVYTPMNSIVFGGNFVHSYDIPAQLRLRQIEIDTKVPQRFRFPLFDKLCWYVADRYCSDLRQSRAYRARALSTLAPPHAVVLEGLVHLARFLISQTDIIENADEEDKKRSLVFNKIPHEIVKDPSGLARELLWRVKRELGHDVDQAAVAEALQPPNTAKQSTQSKPRPRKDPRKSATSRTVNFDPMPWESSDQSPERTTEIVTAARPGTGKEQQAELMTTVTSSLRRRVRETDDGQTVLEEQGVLFTQRKTVWRAAADEGALGMAKQEEL